MIKKITSELIRRGVLRAVGAYIAIVWLLAQGIVDVFPAMGLPDWATRLFLIAAISALPLVALLSWRYDLTKKGFLRDKRDRLSRLTSSRSMHADQTQRSDERTSTNRALIQASWTDQNGDVREQTFSSAFVVGRDYGVDIRLADSRVSRRHVRVYPEDECWLVEDLTSLNGSFIDGVQIKVHRIDGETCISLDKEGPQIRVTPQLAEPTRLTESTS